MADLTWAERWLGLALLLEGRVTGKKAQRPLQRFCPTLLPL